MGRRARPRRQRTGTDAATPRRYRPATFPRGPSSHLPSLPLDDTGWLFALLALVLLVAPPLARRARVPDVVGLLLAGTLVGPAVLGLVERTGVVAALGEAGLLYLLFLAGLELDLAELVRRRRDSLVFGATTFLVPMAVSTPVMLVAGFAPLPAVLLASCWASHTLLSYPTFRRFGVVNSPAVAASVGATIITDTLALLVLVVVVRAHEGGLDLLFWPQLLAGLAGLLAWTGWLLPRAARWLFTVAGRDRTPRLVFLLLALFSSAAVAELVGVEGIVGAFLAGLALNRLVPEGSPLMERVEVLGNGLLVPLFLVSVGLLVDPTLLVDPATLATAALFTGLALATKVGAAWLAGRVTGASGPEWLAMASLSSAQAAATLAAVLIGVEVGLLDEQVVNPVVVVILVTCLVSSWLADRSAPRLAVPARSRSLGRSVLVPIANPDSAGPLVALAAALARADAGLVVPVTVVPPDADPDRVDAARRLAERAEEVVMGTGVEAHAATRVDVDPASGILHAVRETGATLLVLGWKGHSTTRPAALGGLTDAVVTGASVPTLVTRLAATSWSRVVVAVPAADLVPAGLPGVRLALQVAGLLARSGIPVTIATDRHDPGLDALLGAVPGADVHVGPVATVQLAGLLGSGGLLVVPSPPDVRGLQRATRLADGLAADLVTAVDHRPLEG